MNTETIVPDEALSEFFTQFPELLVETPITTTEELLQDIIDNSISEEYIIDPLETTSEETIIIDEDDEDAEDEDAANLIIVPEVPEAPVPIQYTRFKGATWFSVIQQMDITLAGLGGIGSWVNLFLSRLNPNNIYLYDPDRFESINMAGQFVDMHKMNRNKCAVATSMGKDFSNYNKYLSFSTLYEDSSIYSPIMICGFDNMVARKVFFNNWLKAVRVIDTIDPRECLLIDGRLNNVNYLFIQIFFIIFVINLNKHV
jgi:hypothetical protein